MKHALAITVLALLAACENTTYHATTPAGGSITVQHGSFAESNEYQTFTFTSPDGSAITSTKVKKDQISAPKSYLFWRNAPEVIRSTGTATNTLLDTALTPAP